MLKLEGIDIERCVIVDDDALIRNTMLSPVEDLDVEPVMQEEPLPGTVLLATAMLRKKGQALLSDHHLQKKGQYAVFNGAGLVAECTAQKFPAVLCTRWSRTEELLEIRRYRHMIPVLLPGVVDDPDSLQRAFEIVVDEILHGRILPIRKRRRTLLAIEECRPSENEPRTLTVKIYGWDINQFIDIELAALPDAVRQEFLRGPKKYLGAHVNLDAELVEDLAFDRWEIR